MTITASRYEAVHQGGPFKVAEYEVAPPGPNEVVVRNKAVALNPMDWKQLEHGFGLSFPAVFGGDGAGVIEEVGSDVKAYKKGDEVYGSYRPDNSKSAAFQEYSVLPSDEIGLKPKSLSFEEAASIPIGYLTAAAAIYRELGMPLPFLPDSPEEGYKPSKILVLGGSSSVGASTIALLRAVLPSSSSTTIVATSSPQHHEHLRSLGANVALDYKTPSIVQDIKKASGGGGGGEEKGFEVIIDAVNAAADNLSLLETLQPDGSFVEVLTGHNVPSGSVPAGVKHLRVMATKVFDKPGTEHLYSSLAKLVDDGRYKLPLPITVVGKGWDAIGLGLLTLMKQGVSGTKLVVTL